MRPPLRNRSASIFLLLLTACSEQQDGGSRGDSGSTLFDRQKLLAAITHDLLLPLYEEFLATTDGLVTATQHYCTALANNDQAEPLAVRQAWRNTVAVWQRAEALLIGPAAMNQKTLRNRIYGWPLASSCGVDHETVAYWANPTGYDVGTRLDNVRSLAAIEYLLFVQTPMHSCALTPSGWDGLSADLPKARCQLAQTIAVDVAARAKSLQQQWDPAQGNYAAVISQAGTAASPLSQREAINHVSDAFFYVDRMVKDMKVGEAAGISANACGSVGAPCIREAEHQYSDFGTFAIRANLVTLRQAFTLGDDNGFDDYLAAVGAHELAARMTSSLDVAITQAEALPESFLSAVETSREQVVATHQAIKNFTDELKTQFLTVLGLERPDEVAGDND